MLCASLKRLVSSRYFHVLLCIYCLENRAGCARRLFSPVWRIPWQIRNLYRTTDTSSSMKRRVSSDITVSRKTKQIPKRETAREKVLQRGAEVPLYSFSDIVQRHWCLHWGDYVIFIAHSMKLLYYFADAQGNIVNVKN